MVFFLFGDIQQNASFYANRSFINNAKELAAKRDVKALKELASVEVCDPNLDELNTLLY